MQADVKDSIRKRLLELLDDDLPELQSWAFIGLASMASIDDQSEALSRRMPVTPAALASRRSHLQTAWERLWAHAIRKTSVSSISRAACYAAEVVLRTGKVDVARCLRDINSLLKNVDIQGPPVASEAASSFFVACLEHVRADAGLYSANLEDKILDWFAKAFAADNRTRLGIDQASPLDHLHLLSSICNYSTAGINTGAGTEILPDCPTVNRVLYEVRTSSIRTVILDGTLPPVPKSSASSAERLNAPQPLEADFLAFLEGRARKLSDILRTALEVLALDWAPTDRAFLLAAEKLRKAVDLVVLVLLFQASIQLNGFRPDASGCLSSATKLLRLVLPHFRSLSDQDVANQLLVWQGFAPLYQQALRQTELWPILIKPDAASGIRQDLLPLNRYASYYPEDTDGILRNDQLLSIAWTAQEVSGHSFSNDTQTSDVLGEVVQLAKTTLPSVRSTGTTGTTVLLHATDDDDFGPIINADTDAMPQSLEAKEAQRSTSALLKTLVDIRLRGPLLASPDHRPSKDVGLVNTLTTSDGSRFAQLGLGICDAIMEGSLRITVDIVDAVLTEISDRLTTYAFKRDSELLRFAIVFLSRTLPIWLSPESGLAEHAIDIAKSLVRGASAGNMASWQGRLQLLAFIDEYLDYDPNCGAWLHMSETEEADVVMGGTQDELGPLKYLLDATADLDSRVRFRAVSSSSAVHYIPDMPNARKAAMYTELVAAQSTMEYTWDHYLTNLLFKLNTCIASAYLRSTTIFHLYEVADTHAHFISHLQFGLNAVAHRLGLDSLQTLYRADASLVVEAQLRFDQLPMGVPPALYGCASRKEFATLCLQAVGPMLLSTPEPRHLTFFTALCEAAAVPEAQARMRHLPAAASIAVVNAIANSADASDMVVAEQVAAHALTTLPRPEKTQLSSFLASKAEYIVTQLIATVDLSLTNDDISLLLDSHGPTAGETFIRLTAYDTENHGGAPPVLQPSASAFDVLQALSFFRGAFKKMSSRRLVFEALLRLFYTVNNSYLVNEQRRYLRALALLASIYPAEFLNPTILQLFLRNTIELLVLDDIARYALSFLEWGFEQLASSRESPSDLTDLLINLGSSYAQLQGNPNLSNVAARLDEWVASKAKSWTNSDSILPSLTAAVTFWPAHWTEHFHLGPARFGAVAEIAELPHIRNPLALCQRLLATAKANTSMGSTGENADLFLSSTFWHIKEALSTSQWTHDGAMAFLNLLYLTKGEVHAPSLPAIQGLMGRTNLADVSKMYSGKPEVAVRVAVLDKIMEQTNSDNYRLRTTAFEVLQTAFPIIKSTEKGLPAYLHDLVAFLVPSTLVPSAQDSKIDVLIDESSGWVFKSRSHDVWARELALLLSALAAQEDQFYSCLQPLLNTQGSAAVELLPFLVQAVLTSSTEEQPDATTNRATVLSDYFSQVLQYPTASMQTVEAIIQIILHLRHFKPPYGSGELSYDHWLNIDALVLSEAAGRCGAFASSLLFLEMADDRDEEPGASIQLSNARVQKVSGGNEVLTAGYVRHLQQRRGS